MPEVSLLDSAARTESGVQVVGGLHRFGDHRGLAIGLVVSNADTDAGDTLDVFIQKNVGSNESPVWHDFVHFTQVIGTSGAVSKIAYVTADDITTALGDVKDGTLAVGVENGPWSDRLRVKWTIVDAGADDASFTFGVFAHMM